MNWHAKRRELKSFSDGAVTLPNQQRVSLRTYARAWRELKAMVARGEGEKLVPGWDWFPMCADAILRQYRHGLNDRISSTLPWYRKGRKWS